MHTEEIKRLQANTIEAKQVEMTNQVVTKMKESEKKMASLT